MSARQSLALNSRQGINALCAGVCLLLSAAAYWGGLRPMIQERREQRAQQQQLREQHQQLQERSRQLQQLRQQLALTEQAVASEPLRLEPLTALNQRVAQITGLAGRCGLEVDQIRPGASVAGVHYYTVPIHIEGRGEFHAGVDFLHRLHESLPDVAVPVLSLQGRGAGGSPAFRFELTWYAAPPTPAG